MSELVSIGRVGRPHGRDGAFVVEDASEAPERLAVGAELLVDGEPARVVESKQAGGRRVVRLDRDAHRGARLEVPRATRTRPASRSTARTHASTSGRSSPVSSSSTSFAG